MCVQANVSININYICLYMCINNMICIYIYFFLSAAAADRQVSLLFPSPRAVNERRKNDDRIDEPCYRSPHGTQESLPPPALSPPFSHRRRPTPACVCTVKGRSCVFGGSRCEGWGLTVYRPPSGQGRPRRAIRN